MRTIHQPDPVRGCSMRSFPLHAVRLASGRIHPGALRLYCTDMVAAGMQFRFAKHNCTDSETQSQLAQLLHWNLQAYSSSNG